MLKKTKNIEQVAELENTAELYDSVSRNLYVSFLETKMSYR